MKWSEGNLKWGGNRIFPEKGAKMWFVKRNEGIMECGKIKYIQGEG